MFEQEQWDELIAKLVALTKNKTLEWEQDPEQEDTVYLQVQSGPVEYGIFAVDGDDRPPYKFQIFLPSENRVLSSIESKPMEGSGPSSAQEWLPTLFSLARAEALGADRWFKRMIDDLDATGGS